MCQQRGVSSESASREGLSLSAMTTLRAPGLRCAVLGDSCFGGSILCIMSGIAF